MCRVKKSDIEFSLHSNQITKKFKSEKMMNAFIKEFGVKEYRVEVNKNVRGSRLH